MPSVLILVVFAVVVLVLILLAGTEPDRRRGPTAARGLPAQASSPSGQSQGVANHRVDRDDKPSVRWKEVRYRCRHTPSSK